MSIENVKKLELGIAMSCGLGKFENINNLSKDSVQKLVMDGCKLEEEAMQSGEIDVLERAFDYFLEEDPDNGLGNGGCESLEGEIFQYFTWEQIYGVLNQKLGKLVELNIDRAKHFVAACDIEEVRELIKTLTTSQAREFLIELRDFCREDLSKAITDLLKEMKN